MKDSKLLMKDNVVKVSLSFSFAIFIITCILVAFLYTKFPPYIPLLNSLSWGIERIVPTKTLLFLFPIFLVVISLNFILSTFIYKKNPLLGRIIIFNAFLFSLLAFLAITEVIFLIF
jgi:hypothetical protein